MVTGNYAQTRSVKAENSALLLSRKKLYYCSRCEQSICSLTIPYDYRKSETEAGIKWMDNVISLTNNNITCHST